MGLMLCLNEGKDHFDDYVRYTQREQSAADLGIRHLFRTLGASDDQSTEYEMGCSVARLHIAFLTAEPQSHSFVLASR